jgi:hypothetical protein
MAFGSATFTADMQKALEDDVLTGTELTDEDLEYENDLAEDALATSAVAAGGLGLGSGGLMDVPEATQVENEEEDEEQRFDDRQLEMLKNQYSTLTSKTQKIMKILGVQQKMMDNFEEHGTPFEILKAKHAEIEAMPAGDDKVASVKIFNVVSVVFGEARGNPELREFAGKLFSQTSEYYSLKEKKKEMKEELNMLIKLRDEQEIDNFKQKQKKRIESELAEASGKVKRTKF